MLMLTFLILVLVLIFLVLMFSLGLFMFIENKNRSIWIQQPKEMILCMPNGTRSCKLKKKSGVYRHTII